MNCSLLLSINDWFNKLPVFNRYDFDVYDFLPALAGWSSVIGVLVALVLIMGFTFVNRSGRRWRWNPSGKFLTTAFVIVLMAGFVIYDVGMYIGHNRWSLLANVPMAIIHAFEMFLLESDVGAIHSQFHDSVAFMTAFSLVHLAAAVITLVFVIKHFGYNIVAGLRMLFESHWGKRKETYMLWGLNEVSYLMAKSIQDHFGNRKDYRIIVVRTNNEKGSTGVRNGMDRLFNFLSLKNNDLNRLMELDCFTTSTYADLAHVHLNVDGTGQVNDILKKHLGLNRLTRIITHKTTDKLHLFFLAEDAAENIQAIANLKTDEAIAAYATGINRALFYCRARYNSVYQVIENEQMHDNIEVRIVDSSHISVELLKEDVQFHPVSYVNIERDATVSSPFNALVVGFGEVGYDAVRFLYEFGAFVKTGCTASTIERSDFHCDVVDKNIMAMAGPFVVNAPMVSHHISYNDDQPRGTSLITLHDMDCRGVDFYNHVERWIEHLNYVVIALDDDMENVSLAVRIFRQALRYRKDMNRFRIMVRVRNDEDGHLHTIVRHYNRLWAAECRSENPMKRTHQREVLNNEQVDEPITLFGSFEDTYTYDYIVSDKLKNEAMKYKERYDQSIRALHHHSGNACPDILDWETEHRDLMQLTDDYKGFSPTYSGIMRLRRIQRQNKENCFHLHTKRMLARIALGDEKYQLLTSNFLSRNENETSYQWIDHDPDKAVERVIDVLAQTEHLRWVASHAILGYRDDGTEDLKDEARLLHGCLKPWHKLSERIQSYDYNVVDTSLGINKVINLE